VAQRPQIKQHFTGPGSIGVLLPIAFPMVVSQAAETLMMFVDRLFLARLGPEYISAAMTGGLTAFMCMTFFIGTIGYTTALVAQYLGAQRRDRCAVAVTQALLMAVVSYPLILAAIPIGRWMLAIGDHDPLQHTLEVQYYTILIWGAILGLVRMSFSSFFSGIGRTRIVMLGSFVCMIVNVFANYVLIFGRLGFPALGIAGAAYGTLIGSGTGTVFVAVAYFSRHNRREFGTWSGLRLDVDMLRRLLHFGFPSGLEFFLNLAAFNLFVQVFHSYGREVAAAVTVVFNWDLIAFLPTIGLGIATTSLVGRYMGAGQPDFAERSAYSALKAAVLYDAVLVAFFLFAPGLLVSAFSAGWPESEYAAVMPIATRLLRLAGVYVFADAAAIVFGGALRGAGDTRWAMRVSVCLHWLMALVSFAMVKHMHAEPVSVWFVFVLLVVAMGLVFWLRFRSQKWREIKVIDSPND